MTREGGGAAAPVEAAVPFTLVGGAGMMCEGDSCTVPDASVPADIVPADTVPAAAVPTAE